MTVRCDPCDLDAELVAGDVIYPHRPDLGALKFWRCAKCGAYAGTHANSPTHKPKAGLANRETRQARMDAHAAFDGRWRRLGVRRSAAYHWLREQLGIDKTPHIGFMSEEECRRVVALCRDPNPTRDVAQNARRETEPSQGEAAGIRSAGPADTA